MNPSSVCWNPIGTRLVTGITECKATAAAKAYNSLFKRNTSGIHYKGSWSSNFSYNAGSGCKIFALERQTKCKAVFEFC